MFKRMLVFVPMALLVTACSADRPTSVEPAETAGPALSAVKFWDVGATVKWNEQANALAAARAVDAGRMFAYLALAQYKAAEAAKDAPGPHPPVSAAIGGASAVVLRSFFPLDVALIESALDEQEDADPWPGAQHVNFAEGEAIGRDIGARVLTYAAGDNYGVTNPLLPPTGPLPLTPGHWLYSGGPISRGGLGARPFFLSSGDQFRPGPPPAFGSAEYLAALAEVRHISDTRTPEQLAIAIYWNVNLSPRSDAAISGIARELIVSHHRSDAEAARILFLMSASSFDASIGCFDAKYHYWFIRPPQADPLITLPLGLPPHPSYPSAHSCSAGAKTAVLAAIFPDERARLEAVALESSLSRLYGGIHYRFDMEAGIALGRAVAALALSTNLDNVAPLP